MMSLSDPWGGILTITDRCRQRWGLWPIPGVGLSSLSATSFHPPVNALNRQSQARWQWRTYMVKFEVESAGVADRVTFTVASPESGRGRQTVGTLQPSATSAHLQHASSVPWHWLHSSYYVYTSDTSDHNLNIYSALITSFISCSGCCSALAAILRLCVI